MAGSGEGTAGGGMPFAGLALILIALLAGCAPSAPGTITPARPTGEATAAPDPETPGASGDEATDGSAPEPPASAGEDPDGPGNGDTRQGRGDKAPVGYDELVDLGEELTGALESGDVEQWMGLTALRGDAAQQQRDWFAGVQAVPMDVREMHPTWLIERDVKGDVHGPLVEFSFRHQVSGADAVPTIEIYEFTLERVGTDGPYRIVGVSGSDSYDAAYPQLWDLRPIEVVETEHAVLIGEKGSGVEELAEALDLGAAAVWGQFPVDGVNRMAVSVVDESLVATLFGDSEEGAFAGYAIPVAGSPSVEDGRTLPEVMTDDSIGARLVIDQDYAEGEWDLFDEPDGGLPLMRHEGLHLAMMLRYPDDVPPRWAIEGFAGWFEVTGDPQVLESHEQWYPLIVDEDNLPEALPPSDYDTFFADDEALERNYLEAANVFLYVDEAYGAETAKGLGEDLHGYDLWTDDDADLEEIFAAQLGVDQTEFETGYLDWVRDTYGE